MEWIFPNGITQHLPSYHRNYNGVNQPIGHNINMFSSNNFSNQIKFGEILSNKNVNFEYAILIKNV